MTVVNRFAPSQMPAMASPGFVHADKHHDENLKRYGGYKSKCRRCKLDCKQFNNPGLIIKYCHHKGWWKEEEQ